MSDSNASESNQSKPGKTRVNIPVSIVIIVPVEVDGDPICDGDEVFGIPCADIEANEHLLSATIEAMKTSETYQEVLTQAMAIAIKVKAANSDVKVLCSAFAGVTPEETL